MPNNGGKAPTPIVPNPDQIIQPPVSPNNQEVVETQPMLPAEDEIVPLLQPMHIVTDHTALFPVPYVPNPAPTNAYPILSTNHEYNWYKYNDIVQYSQSNKSSELLDYIELGLDSISLNFLESMKVVYQDENAVVLD